MSIPKFGLLIGDQQRHARLVTIRNAVVPLLATNYLSHFTDHSVSHSDRLCDLIDELTVSLTAEKKLSPVEAATLYAACYFHDAGMQHEKAFETKVVQEVLQNEPYCGQQWSDLSISTRQEIVRVNHHRISDELVRNAVRAGETPLGISLIEESDIPGIVACLCRAHCLNTESEEYQEITADSGGIRVSLLSALLRLADILDESQRRSHIHLERVRELPLESRLHWWRHYYVSSIEVNPQAVTVWFNFPPDRRPQYKALFEPLQMPWIEAEFSRHANVLAANGLAWNLQACDTPPAQCTSRVMDDELERYGIEKHVARQAELERQQRAATVRQLRMARPGIANQFASLRESTKSPEEQLEIAVALAEHLTRIGGCRDGWMSLHSQFSRLKDRVKEPLRSEIALRLGELMIADQNFDFAIRFLGENRPHFQSLNDSESAKIRFLQLWSTVLRNECHYEQAIGSFSDVARLTKDKKIRDSAAAEIAEMHLLQGELDKIMSGK